MFVLVFWFVPFKKFENNEQKLALEVLEEIPRQVVEYYQHQKINPKDDEDNNTYNLIENTLHFLKHLHYNGN